MSKYHVIKENNSGFIISSHNTLKNACVKKEKVNQQKPHWHACVIRGRKVYEHNGYDLVPWIKKAALSS